MMASKTPHQNVTFDLPTKDAGQDGDRTGHGYLALPASGKGPGVIVIQEWWGLVDHIKDCLLYTSPSPRDRQKSRMPSSA